MSSFIKSLVNRTEPDIMEGLSPLGDVLEVTDYCFLDAGGEVIGAVSKYGNDQSLFSYLGKEVARMALLLGDFGGKMGSEVGYCQLQCKNGVVLVWCFEGSFLMVMLNGAKQIPIVRMTVNVFRDNASKGKHFAKYFSEPEKSVGEMWGKDRDLSDCIESVFGKRKEEG